MPGIEGERLVVDGQHRSAPPAPGARLAITLVETLAVFVVIGVFHATGWV